MELSAFRQRLLRGDVHLANREKLLGEYRYFASIAPKSSFSGIGEFIRGIGDKLHSFTGGNTAIMIILMVLAVPIIIALFSMAMPVLMIILLTSFMSTSRQSPEYKNFNYVSRIVDLMCKLFDDKLSPNFHYSWADIIDEEKSYDDALVEARLVSPFHKKAYGHTSTSLSYDWDNVRDTDSFEFLGYKIYYEWRDDDGDTHEEVFFDGCIYKFHTSFTLNGTVNIMSTVTKKGLMGGEKEVSKFKYIKDKEVNVIDTENQYFAENFDTIATYEEEAYRFLTPAMIETLLRLRQDYYFCICIKGNVMTVAIDKGGFKSANPYTMSIMKPYFAPKDPEAEMNRKINDCRNAILSIYELKDLLDPAGMYIV